MKSKGLNVLLILTSLIGYLEWGKNNKSFLFQAEVEIISKLFTDPLSVLHPFTFLPLIGQLILVFTLFQKSPNRFLTFVGMIGIGILLMLMFAIGAMTLNFYIVLSTVPFLMVSVLTVRYHLKLNRDGNKKS